MNFMATKNTIRRHCEQPLCLSVLSVVKTLVIDFFAFDTL